MSQAYDALAVAYDGLMGDVQYKKRIGYLHRLLKKTKRTVTTVADLGCGTGTISLGLAEKGYDVIAMDPAEQMLTQAMDKAQEMALEHPPLFACQAMERLQLPTGVDAIVSTIDAVNYVTSPKALERAFARMYRHLHSGGRLIFDVNTPYKYATMDGQMYVDETEDAYCVWRTFYNAKQCIATYEVDLFTQMEDDTWERSWEQHRQRSYTQGELSQMLRQAGFEAVSFYSDLTTEPATQTDMRWIVVCDQ